MFGQVILDHDIFLPFGIGTIRLHHQQFSFFELVLGHALVDAADIVGIICDLEAFLHALAQLERPA